MIHQLPVMKNQKKSLFLLLILTFWACSTEQEPANVSFYFGAHPDDWQLFIGERAWADVQDANTKTVFVLTTAGDAAAGMATGPGANQPYYLAREIGFMNSIFWAEGGKIQIDSAGRSTLPLQEYELSVVGLNGHPLKHYSLDNISVYLFYLPDGFPDGGYRWSLQKLKEGIISDMPTIDSTTLYADWNDLKSTVETLIQREISGNESLRFNLADTDTTINPGDHSDHQYTSFLAQEASQGLGADYLFFQEYVTSQRQENLTEQEARIKKFLFSANALSKERAGYPTPWDAFHLAWTTRTYDREILAE